MPRKRYRKVKPPKVLDAFEELLEQAKELFNREPPKPPTARKGKGVN